MLRIFVKIYIFINKKKDIVKDEKIITIDNCTIKECTLYKNDKKHTIRFIYDDKLKNFTYNFDVSVKDYLNNKNDIVYSSIVDDNDNIMIDVTEILRSFSHYFDSHILLSSFLKYVEYYYNTNKRKELNNIDINDYIFVIYMNDENFTEYRFKIKDVLSKTFYEIFNKKIQ